MWRKGRVYKPVEEMDLSAASKEEYVQEKVLVPRAFGILLKVFCWVLESRIFGSIAVYIIKWGNMIPEFFTNAHIKEPPMYFPKFPEEEFDERDVICMDPGSTAQEKAAQVINCLLAYPSRKKTENEPFFRHWTIRDFSRAYLSGEVTPTEVAERFLSVLEQSIKRSPGMCIFISYNSVDIFKQAAESTSRYKRGEPLSVLDGVPIAVKDEIDCLPYPTTGGTKWLHTVRKVTDDSTCVKRLRTCGAVLIGKTNMHELGVGTTGINPHYGATRNPYDTEKISGGSSSGSAAAVSAGLCPAAFGVDGGGSVRMPAALCGVVGFKPTYGRLCHSGVLPLNWTVGMLGILASSVEDALIVYAAIIGHTLSKSVSLPPHIRLPLLEKSESIRDLKLAKYTKWFDHCDDAVRSKCYKALNLLKLHYGCETFEVTLPELEEMRRAHYITIGCECDASFSHDFENLGRAFREKKKEFVAQRHHKSSENRLTFALISRSVFRRFLLQKIFSMNQGDNKGMMLNFNNPGPPLGKFKMGWKNNGGNFLAPRSRDDNININMNMNGGHMNLNPSSSSAAPQPFNGRATYLAPRPKWKVRNKAEKRKRKVADSTAGGAVATFQSRPYEPPKLHELQARNRLKARKYYPKKKFSRFAPLAPRNTTSFIIQAKRNGGIAELVSPCPVTPAVLPTPIISPAREGLADMAKQEWGLYGYGSMKGFIRLKDNDSGFEGETRDDDESSSGSDVEEHVEMERRLDHDLSRFVMTYPSTSSPQREGFDGPRCLETRVDDQDNHIARLEEENLTLKERLFLMEQEMEDLRRRMMNLEGGNPNMNNNNNCAVIDNNNSNVIDNIATDDDAAEVCSEKSVGDGDGERHGNGNRKPVDGGDEERHGDCNGIIKAVEGGDEERNGGCYGNEKASDGGERVEADGSRPVAENHSCD